MSNLRGEGSTGFILWEGSILVISAFAIKNQFKDEMSVSSFDLVDTLKMYNIKIIIKMLIAVTIIQTEIRIIIFNCF